jgi:tRNA(Ile2) C34 agmatinyltransferase TiaS
MSIYDPLLPPEYPECPYCGHALEDKGKLFQDWECVNPRCEYSDFYEEPVSAREVTK